MSEEETGRETTDQTHQGYVVSVLSSSRLVINQGEENNVEVGDKFLVFEVSDEEIVDPKTQESLGKLELPKGTGRVIHVQERMAIIESDKERPPQRRIVRRPTSISAMMGQSEEEEYVVSTKREPFSNPVVGDLVKFA